MIITQPKSVTVFNVEDLLMSCEASGNPPPIFRWTKDGEEFDPDSDKELKVSESSGSFVFRTWSKDMETVKKYEGKYVCFASNELGTAMSDEAVLNTDDEKVNAKADEGNSIVLKCNPSQSSMKHIIHWMDGTLHHIQLNERVVVGKDGNLYFAYLTAEDSRNDYTCNAQYPDTQIILAKQPITLTVNPSNSVPRNRRPHMMRPTGSHSTYHALRGQTIELECIVQGLPTPKVSWLRKDGEMSESRTTKDMFGRRFRFTNISESDGGEYQCIAENSQGKAFHTYTLTVEATPYWTKEPTSQLYAPGETVRLECQADGIPSPTISWMINGIPISDPRRTLTSGSLILEDVNFGDTAIYQCKGTNKHGTILTNTNVYVIELAPQILTEDGNTYTFTEGQKALLECETFGSPKPKLVSACRVPSFSLPDRTVILSPPEAVKVQPGNTATFSCQALTDPSACFEDEMRVKYDKYGHLCLRYTFEGEKFMITNASPEDEGVYTCQVITRMDMAEASGSLTLYDRPDPPTLLQFSNFKYRSLTLSWTPGDDNNSPVLEYVVEFEDQGSKERGWEELKRVGGNQERVTLSLWPYISYRFRVIAINDLGKSEPSKASEIHNTPAEAPDNNPEDVRSESVDPGTLVITWQKMDKRHFNGPDFKYKVLWRRVVGSGPNWHMNYTTGPPFIVSDIGNFSAFEIKVQAENEEGAGPRPDPVIGYSGEDVPIEAPIDVGVLLIDSTTIKVTWAAVDKDTVRGHLLGYKVHLLLLLCWKGLRTHHQGRRIRELDSTVVVETGPNEEKKVIGDLKPFSHYVLVVTVYNKKGEGPPSETLSFKTQEGVPGPPMSLSLDSQSETEMTLHWGPPVEPNGILVGYLLQYQQGNPMQVEEIVDPKVTQLTLRNLDRHSHYRFYLRGRTETGDGEPVMVKGATTLDGGKRLVDCSLRHRNIDFQIQYYKKKDGKKTEKVSSSQSSHQLQGLTPGTHYWLRFIHNNNSFWETEIDTNGTVQQSIATQGWFIGVVSAIVLLLLILLILCFIRRSKGGKYSVKDKEEGPMDSEARPMKDETFGEYSDLEEKRTASQPSLGEESKLCSQDNLDFNGSSAMTTELNMDESLASQVSRPSDGLPDHSLLHPTAVSSASNGMPNSVTILD
uniref:Neural cell adhesion molecule L1 n=1 Tax=Gouania willdenowi TaxID=441366 RepID=A0A8C5H529_GOUWI